MALFFNVYKLKNYKQNQVYLSYNWNNPYYKTVRSMPYIFWKALYILKKLEA